MNTRIEQKQATRRKLIEASLKLSAEQSFAALSLREVAKEAGITPAAFYRHFKDMNELGLSLVDEVGVRLRQMMRDARKGFDQKQSAVKASVETYVEFIIENPQHFRLLMGERQAGSPEFQIALRAEIDRFIAELTDDLEMGSKKMKLPIYDAAFAAEAIVAVVFTVGAEALNLPKHRRQALLDRLVKEINMILRGSRVKPR